MRGPTSTYRIQTGTAGGLAAVGELVPYLRDLGVGTLYLSPVFRAKSGSEHGYDVVDPGRVDPALGGEPALEALGQTCRDAGLSLLLDVVPNHMAASHENPWWWALLEDGRAADTGGWFDVGWDEPPEPVRGRVMLPILGRRYPRALAAGDFQVVRGREGVLLRYHDRVLPLNVSAHPDLAGRGDAAVDELVERLDRAGTDPRARRELDALLARQPYWLAHWRTAGEEINYRRFFNITDLVGLRMEREEVFRAWHRLLASLLSSLPVAGLRVDHVDGLRDPAGYLARLRRLVDDAASRPDGLAVLVEKILGPGETLPGTWETDGTTGYDFLAAAGAALLDPDGLERLRAAYRSFTGTGHGFREQARRDKRKVARSHFRGDLGRLVDRALPPVRRDPRGRDLTRSEVEATLVEITAQLPVYRTYAGGGDDDGPGPSPLESAVARGEERRPDLPSEAFRVLGELLSGSGGATADAPTGASEGAEDAEDADPADGSARPGEAEPAAVRDLVDRWRQLTGAVAAKGVEDTAFYVHVPLVSLNEVGADPDHAPVAVSELHETLRARGDRTPGTLNTTSTHDTKRSEDVRARLHVLAEMAGEWSSRVEDWHGWNRPCRREAGGRTVPTANEEWRLYQTLVGVWPLGDADREELVARVRRSARKAAREAKTHTSWTRPRRAHEDALLGFVGRILDPARDSPFLGSFRDVRERVAFHGAVNSLAQLVLKLAAPGVPDVYQGDGLWRFSLVDPDNRRPVDWDRRRRLLAELRRGLDDAGDGADRMPDGALRRLLDGWEDGRVKLLVTWRGLEHRRRRPRLLRRGDYRALTVTGEGREHVIAFARRLDDRWTIAVAPRLPAGLTPPGTFPVGERVWGDTALRLPDGAPAGWRDVLTGAPVEAPGGDARLRLPDVLGRLPVAILEGRARAR